VSPGVVVAVIIAAVVIVVAGAGYAWWDWRYHPERYGATQRDRAKRRRWLTRPSRGGTRQPIRHWHGTSRHRSNEPAGYEYPTRRPKRQRRWRPPTRGTDHFPPSDKPVRVDPDDVQP
jgi:hypothetical protein